MTTADVSARLGGARKMVFATDLQCPEGPVALSDGSWLIAEAGGRGCVSHITSDGKGKRIVASTGLPNGLAVDREGIIWVAEPKTPSLIRLTMDGQATVFMTECNGEPFLYPNDLCFGPDGALYMTDSGILMDDFEPGGKIRPDYMTAKVDGCVYRIDIKTRAISTLDSGFRFTNGLAFGPDNSLYVNETMSGMIYRYQWREGQGLGPRESFGNVLSGKGHDSLRGPDGMAFGTDGKLYVAVYGQGDVTVLGQDGQVLTRLRTKGIMPTNVAFGLPGQRKIYVTEYELGQMETFDVGTDGLPLWS
jgi:gluconolactonase